VRARVIRKLDLRYFDMIDEQLRENFLNLSMSELHDIYYQCNIDGDEILFSHSTGERLGFELTLRYPSQKFICPDTHLKVFRSCVVEYGNMLYRHEQSGGSWRDFATVKDLVANGNY
jgi:hypothetical protein